MISNMNSTQKNVVSTVKTNKTTWSNRGSSPRSPHLRLVQSDKSTNNDAVHEIQKLIEKLAQVEGVSRCRAVATSFPDIHWIDFEIELKINIQLSDKTWEQIQDMVIDCEWKLRDDSGKKWYFRPQIVDQFDTFGDEVVADSEEKHHMELGKTNILSSNHHHFRIVS